MCLLNYLFTYLLVPTVPHPQQLADFRPTSVTQILSRIAEKLIVTKWLRPAIPPKPIADQFDFKPTGSTTCGLVCFIVGITLCAIAHP